MAGPDDTETVQPTLAVEEERLPPMPRWLLGSAAGLVLLAAALPAAVLYFIPEKFHDETAQIVIVLVGGVIAVMLLLYFGSIILRALGVASRGAALGMPDGSIRALIAVSLIFLFAIIGITVLYSSFGGEEMQSNGITADEIDQLENVQIISISAVDPQASPGAERFNVVSRAELNQASHDFGLQLLTTVSTLVVAVAGFYFGARSVDQATKAALLIQARSATRGASATASNEEAEIEAAELGEDEVIEAREDNAAEDDEELVASEHAPATKPGQQPPGTAGPADTQPGDAKASAAKPSDTKPAAAKPSDTKPAASKPADSKPSDSKPSDKP